MCYNDVGGQEPTRRKASDKLTVISLLTRRPIPHWTVPQGPVYPAGPLFLPQLAAQPLAGVLSPSTADRARGRNCLNASGIDGPDHFAGETYQLAGIAARLITICTGARMSYDLGLRGVRMRRAETCGGRVSPCRRIEMTFHERDNAHGPMVLKC